MINRKQSWIFLLFILFFGCQNDSTETPKTENTQPNILWLVAEDLSPIIPSFGDSTVQTPNLSRLAAEGVRYSNVYSVSGVCAPSRSTLCTGMYQTSIGTHHMRTTFQTENAKKDLGLINYECVIPPQVKMVSEIMRQNGYYCTNNSKTDYQFRASQMAWDESSNYAHWRNCPEGKPFFSIFNFGVTHEGQVWNPASRWNLRFSRDTFPPNRTTGMQWRKPKDGERKAWLVSEDLEVPIPPYLPDTELVKNDLRQVYSNIVELDEYIGIVLKQLEEDGFLEETIIVFYADHGGPLPRQKRLLFDSGLKVPMIIRYPNQERAGEVDDQLISFVDFAPTLLSMANIEPPKYMQGRAHEGKFQSSEKRKYIHAAADRFDEVYDTKRAVRDSRFKYIKNFQPKKPYYLPLAYREQMATMQELLRLRDEGGLNEVQMQWFRETKEPEELFDTENDPFEINNLANNPEYAEKITELRTELVRWMEDIIDLGQVPETELIEQYWPNKIQPKTSNPEIKNKNGKIQISCSTDGASIGYKKIGNEQPWLGWQVYENPIEIDENDSLLILAHRIGYSASDTIRIGR